MLPGDGGCAQRGTGRLRRPQAPPGSHHGALPFARCTDIGWRLGAAHWGKGYATEAAAACLRHGFERLGLDDIVSFTAPDNLRSRQVMERLGMRRDPDGDFDHPALPAAHRLARHGLYRMARPVDQGWRRAVP